MGDLDLCTRSYVNNYDFDREKLIKILNTLSMVSDDYHNSRKTIGRVRNILHVLSVTDRYGMGSVYSV